jgi:PAT family beta-lactamase induction signal transducer AmpG
VTSLTLMTWLRDAGTDLGTIGLISFAASFYVLKPLWSPLLDRYLAPGVAALGRRRGWILLSQLVLTVALVGMALRGAEGPILVFVLLIALAALAGATQDIVVDAYRVEVAPPEEQAALAATYSLGYRIALYASGAGALFLAEFQSWRVAYLAMAGLMLLPLAATLWCAEPTDTRSAEIRNFNLRESFLKPFQEFFSRNGVILALGLLAFVGLFKFPDQVIGVMAGPFYIDSGYSKADIGTVSKIYGVWIGLAGAFLGGFGVALFGIRRMLFLATVVVAVSNIAYLLMAEHPAELWAFFAAISADNLSQGFAGTVLIAFMSGLTHRHFTATQYALLVSLANLPGRFVGGLSGFLVESTSYTVFFIISSLTVLPTLLLLAWLWPRIGEREES